jgi:hypothetical protein
MFVSIVKRRHETDLSSDAQSIGVEKGECRVRREEGRERSRVECSVLLKIGEPSSLSFAGRTANFLAKLQLGFYLALSGRRFIGK